MARAEEEAEEETKKVRQHFFWRQHISMSLLFCFILVLIYYVSIQSLSVLGSGR